MKDITNITFYLLILMVPIGLLLRIEDIMIGIIISLFGFLGLLIFFIIKLIKDWTANKTPAKILFVSLLYPLMTITLFCKYFYHTFWDYPALVIVPLFVVFSIISLLKKKPKDARFVTTNVVFLVLTIPLFAFSFLNEPRKYIPIQWYNRYDVKGVLINIPYKFKSAQAHKLDRQATNLNISGEHRMAILLYQEARNVEPDNQYILFDMSEAYAEINDLEKAISLLDTAISIDSSCASFYNNRGLLYYKMKMNKNAIADYSTAIKLDSTLQSIYVNFALVYYYDKQFNKSCKAIKKLDELKFDYSNDDVLMRIKQMHCE